MSLRRLIGMLATAVLASCSSSGSGSGGGEDTGTSYAALCAGAPRQAGDGAETLESCPFIQQADNISKFGEPQDDRRVYDGAGVFVATASGTCDKWALAKDAQGVTIILQRESGEVISHGSVHPGQGVSQLPVRLTLPLRIE